MSIVFLQVGDPVGSGFVASLARPGGTVTGLTNFESTMVGKWLELLKEIAPPVTRAIAILYPDHPFRPALAISGDGCAIVGRGIPASPVHNVPRSMRRG